MRMSISSDNNKSSIRQQQGQHELPNSTASLSLLKNNSNFRITSLPLLASKSILLLLLMLLLPTPRAAFIVDSTCAYLSRLRLSKRSSSTKYNDHLYYTSKTTSLFDTNTYLDYSTVTTTTNTVAPQDKHALSMNENPPKQLKRSTQTDPIRKESSHEDHVSKIASSPKSSSENDTFERLFALSLPEGYCVGLRYQHSNDDGNSNTNGLVSSNTNNHVHSYLHKEELDYGAAIPSTIAQVAFYIGRVAMHLGLQQIHKNTPTATIAETASAILKDKYGRPMLPVGYLGSISHKKYVGVSLVDTIVSGMKKGIGIDIEQTFTRRNIDKRVLTQKEILELGSIQGISTDEEVLLRFSLKESLYKAMHPLINQRVGFHEAEITPHENGTATVNFCMAHNLNRQFGRVTAHWRRIYVNEEGYDEEDGNCHASRGEAISYFLTSASVTNKFDFV